ncbi:MAG: efflux system, outer rane lipoprotein NodT family [Phycisphaerales bacterium]|nr:efflux system, outer rane lipoprotein NodT family [Phycisphaerales bacterium]
MRANVKQPESTRMHRPIFFLLSAALLTTGCAVGPNFKKPKAQLPGGWAAPPAVSYPTTRPMKFDGPEADLANWWTRFNDPALNSLVERAIVANLDVRTATSAVRQARAARGVTAAELFPQVNTSGGYRRGGAAGTGPTGLYSAGLDASWEIDIFGGRRRSVEAADAQFDATIENRRDVLISVISEVAVNYVNLRGTQRQIEIAQGNLELQKKNAQLVRALFNNGNGFNSRLDVAQADASVASTASQIPSLEVTARQTIYAISVLLGQSPADLLPELSIQSPLPVAPVDVPLGLPSNLLQRRPDIRRAEAQLHVATAQIGVATADLFPRFSLTGSFGYQNGKAGSLFDYSSSAWSFGPGVTWPLFDAGRIFNNIKVQDEAATQAILAYRSVVLTALQEVENSLVAYVKEYERRAALADAVTANHEALRLATLRYSTGETDFLQVLSAQQSLFSTENALVQSDRTSVTNLISLYKALGGGWESERGLTDAEFSAANQNTVK